MPNYFQQALQTQMGIVKNPMKIITTGNPIYQRPYRAPLNKRDEISKSIDDMLKAGVIKPSSSPWASPVTLVPKGEGWRFCVDYRKINQVTKHDQYPVPRIDEIFDLLQGNSVLSTLDLKNGYHQLFIDPTDRENCICLPQRPIRVFTCPIRLSKCTCTVSENYGSHLL